MVAHQKTAKYCLEIQGEHTEEKTFHCEHCQKSLTQQKSLEIHLISCKERKKKVAQTKEAENTTTIKKLESEILKLKKSEKDKLKEKNEHIGRLETTIAKHEEQLREKDRIIAEIALQPRGVDNRVQIPDEDDIPVPLGERLDAIVIEIEQKEDPEYQSVTLNEVVITSRPLDHYVNATQLCQAGGKKFNDWFRLDTTKELIQELSADAGIPATGLLDVKRGGNNKSEQGSWIHPDLSIQLAQWISPQFALQVSRWIRSLFNTGAASISNEILEEMRQRDRRIKALEDVCLAKRKRTEYPGRNVIYLLTTEDHLRRRTYIIGKARNLTSRLGTYNKTCDHTVVHYRECKSEEDMDVAETMILTKLKDYREQSNRDRFVLPPEGVVDLFVTTINECVQFLV